MVIGVTSPCGIGICMVAVFFSETVRPNAPQNLTITAIISSNPRGDRDAMHASSAYSIPHTARRTHTNAVSGPTVPGCILPVNGD